VSNLLSIQNVSCKTSKHGLEDKSCSGCEENRRVCYQDIAYGRVETLLSGVAIVAFVDSLSHSLFPSLSSMLLWRQGQRHTYIKLHALYFSIVSSVESSIK
jgi:hypothetical protein